MIPIESELLHFSGGAPIFPLPNLVLFPNTSIPLHMFEDRYRRMTRDALAGEQLLAMALLQPGWEADYEGRPAVHEMMCLGRIVSHEKLPSGRYNLVLRGIQRAVLVEEVESDTPYRVGKLELYRDYYPEQPKVPVDVRRREVITAFRRLFPRGRFEPIWAQLGDMQLSLGLLCDVLGNALQIPAEVKQALLEELDVEERARLLLQIIQQVETDRGFTGGESLFPDFSLN